MLFSPQIIARRATMSISNPGGAESQAFLARTSGLDSAHRFAYADLIDGLVTDSVWSKLDVLHVYATQDSTTALLNLVSSSFAGIFPISSPTFTADLGFTGTNGHNNYIDTQFNPTTATSPNFVQNSAHVSAWSVTDVGGNDNAIIGSLNGETDIYPKYIDGNAYFRINSGGIGGVANAVPTGHYIANRSSSSAVQGYKNGSSVLTNGSATSNAPANQSFFSLAANNGGTAFGGNHQCAAISIGSSLSSTDAGNLYARLRTYMTAVGVP